MATIDELMRPLLRDAQQRSVMTGSQATMLEDEFRRMALNDALVSQWTAAGATFPRFEYFEANTGRFIGDTPFEVARLTVSSQSIPDVTETNLSFSSMDFNKHALLGWDSLSPEEIRFTGGHREHLYLITGQVSWAASSTGGRRVNVLGFDASDAQTFNTKLNWVPATTNTVQTIAYTVFLSSGDEYLKISVYQNSGASLTVDSAEINIMRVF
ncbi:MAG: hypothetical protein OEZ02_14375 [Anaerolineae bacterium]|nr:hypothetical protein [Anaerolineae bacterium]